MTYKVYDTTTGSSVELLGHVKEKTLLISVEDGGSLPDFITLSLDERDVDDMLIALDVIKGQLSQI